MADTSGPAIVHCSAGIGRTAVLIAVDIGLQGILQGEAKVDVLRVVSTMRQDRAGSVQTRDQYRFIHQVRESAVCYNSSTNNHNAVYVQFVITLVWIVRFIQFKQIYVACNELFHMVCLTFFEQGAQI